MTPTPVTPRRGAIGSGGAGEASPSVKLCYGCGKVLTRCTCGK